MLAVLVTVGLVLRGVRRLHKRGRQLTGEPIDADGVSPAAMAFISK